MSNHPRLLVLALAATLAGCAAEDEPTESPEGASEEAEQDLVALTPCGDALCEGDEYCCNESCSICAPIDGGTCTMQLCNDVPPLGEPCGEIACGIGEVCCDASCGLCAADEDACGFFECGPIQLIPCGDAWCGPGEHCCNPSCGICAPLGGTCTMQLCDADPVLGEPCGDRACEVGQVCCDASCGACAESQEQCGSMHCALPAELVVSPVLLDRRVRPR